MAFRIVLECDLCGRILNIEDVVPDKCVCQEVEDNQPEEKEFVYVVSKQEAKERYRYQYKLNGYSWGDGPAYMYLGRMPNYNISLIDIRWTKE